MEPLSYSKGMPVEDLPYNPHTRTPIILVPKQILRDLPVAESFADIFWIAKHNETLRNELNKIVVGSLRSLTTSERKHRVRESFLNHPDALAQVIAAYESAGAKFYDFSDDPAGETIWYRVSRTLPSAHSLELSLAAKPTIDDVYVVAHQIYEHFKRLIEDNQLCRLLYDKDGYRKH